MNEISKRFCEISQNFSNEIFDEILRKKMNEISRNFCYEILTKFREISRNQIHFRTYFVFRDHPSQ
jgi:hypothetical protein